jgi:hypothetical protein
VQRDPPGGQPGGAAARAGVGRGDPNRLARRSRRRSQETGRWEPAGLVVTSWLQGTSRDGDPHDHVHNLFARMVRTDRDGKWRALDTMALRYQLPAMNAIAAAHVEAALTREFGVEWVPREDGAGNEIRGVAQEIIDEFLHRQDSVNARVRVLSQLHEQRYGRAPNQQELMWLKDIAWEDTRDGKPEAELDWDAHCADLNTRVGGKLAHVARGSRAACAARTPA